MPAFSLSRESGELNYHVNNVNLLAENNFTRETTTHAIFVRNTYGNIRHSNTYFRLFLDSVSNLNSFQRLIYNFN